MNPISIVPFGEEFRLYKGEVLIGYVYHYGGKWLFVREGVLDTPDMQTITRFMERLERDDWKFVPTIEDFQEASLALFSSVNQSKRGFYLLADIMLMYIDEYKKKITQEFSVDYLFERKELLNFFNVIIWFIRDITMDIEKAYFEHIENHEEAVERLTGINPSMWEWINVKWSPPVPIKRSKEDEDN